MDHKDPPPSYAGPGLGNTDYIQPNPLEMPAYPPQPAFDAAPPHAVFQVAPSTTPSTTIIQPAVQPAVVVVNPVVVQPSLKDVPGQLKCTFCHRDVVTVTRPIFGRLTWLVFGGLCLFGIWPCCLIPFCMTSCQDIEHSCPNCHSIFSIYRRM